MLCAGGPLALNHRCTIGQDPSGAAWPRSAPDVAAVEHASALVRPSGPALLAFAPHGNREPRRARIAGGPTMAVDDALEDVAQIAQEMPSVGDLNGLRGTASRALGIAAGPITGDHLDAGVLLEPTRNSVGAPVRQELDDLATLEVAYDRAVALAAPECPVVNADHAPRPPRLDCGGADQAQKRIPARRHREASRQPRSGLLVGGAQPRSSTDAHRHHRREPFGEDAAGASCTIAAKATHGTVRSRPSARARAGRQGNAGSGCEPAIKRHAELDPLRRLELDPRLSC